MRFGRTFRRRRRKHAQKCVNTHMSPAWLMSQWICSNGFNKRDCSVTIKNFNGIYCLAFR